MSDQELDRRLRAYLDYDEKDRQRRSEREERLEKSLGHVSDQLQIVDRKVDLFAVEIREQVKGINARITKLEDDAEDTGVHDLNAIKEREKEAKERLKEAQQSKSQLLGWIIGAMGALGMMLLSGAATVIWYLITHPVIQALPHP